MENLKLACLLKACTCWAPWPARRCFSSARIWTPCTGSLLQDKNLFSNFRTFIRIHWYTIPPTFRYIVREGEFDYRVFIFYFKLLGMIQHFGTRHWLAFHIIFHFLLCWIYACIVKPCEMNAAGQKSTSFRGTIAWYGFVYSFFVHFFGGLECVGHSFAYVAHIVSLRDVWIRTQSAAVASRRATNLATHPHA